MVRLIRACGALLLVVASDACAVPCVDDGLLAMQHDASCRSTTTTDTGSSGTTAGATTSGVTSTTDGTTSAATSTGDVTTTGSTGSSSTGGGVCGDGAVDPGEECDDGPNNGDDQGCKLDCTAQVCGDGALGPGEGCDDGNVQAGDGCDESCVLESCGNLQIDPGEECDDGQDGDPDDGCTDLCTVPVCGDGLLQASLQEECDEGVNNSDDAACTLGCTVASCGDGLVLAGVEECDDGPDNGDDKACKLDCTAQACGDGKLGPGEGCDDGNVVDGDGCSAACVSESCGDNVVNIGEACDDGQNGDQDDGCTDLCTLPACGDGFLQPSEMEECDEGPSNKNDGACTLGCKTAKCGDGFVRVGVEECDDGNMVNNDACTNMCKDPKCGDGIVQMDEECDDGNLVQTDACLNTCKSAKCGDSVVLAGVEACDDGNVIDGDGCPASCTVDFRVVLDANHTCALLTNGEVHCWGDGSKGQLAIGNTLVLGDTANELPTPAATFGGLVVDIAVGAASTCALLADGAVRCAGDNVKGQLGINSTVVIGDTMAELPPANSAVGKPAKAVFGASGTFCVITTDNALRCWGDNSDGQLGLGSVGNAGDQPGELPKPDVPVGFAPVQITAGNNHTCARSAAGKVRCWGQNNEGQLGYGNTIVLGDGPGELPTADVNIGGTVIDISSGVHHTCAVLDDGAVRCWGRNTKGQLGIGSTVTIGDGPGEMPPASVNLGGLAARVSCGVNHSCALMNDGKVRCWGENTFGQLGIGSTVTIGDGPGEMPPVAAGLGGAALALYGGTNADSHCALLAGEQLRCWGANGTGQLGLGSTTTIGDNELPSSVSFVPYK